MSAFETDVRRRLAELKGLRYAAIVSTCLPGDTRVWLRADQTLAPETIGRHLGGLLAAYREHLDPLTPEMTERTTLITSPSGSMVLEHVTGPWWLAASFEASTLVGVAKRQTRGLIPYIRPHLPEHCARAAEAISYACSYTSDKDSLMLRLALQAGVSLEALQEPSQLVGDDATRVERAVCDVLGLDQLPF